MKTLSIPSHPAITCRSRHTLRTTLVAASLALLAACGPNTGVTSAPRPAKATTLPPVRPASPTGARDPQFLSMAGLEGVIGVTEKSLVRQFGQPRLDVWEGDARKLQFSGRACMLDIYLYPTSSSREPVATYLDARRHSDGKDVDRAACVAALRQK